MLIDCFGYIVFFTSFALVYMRQSCLEWFGDDRAVDYVIDIFHTNVFRPTFNPLRQIQCARQKRFPQPARTLPLYPPEKVKKRFYEVRLCDQCYPHLLRVQPNERTKLITIITWQLIKSPSTTRVYLYSRYLLLEILCFHCIVI